MVALRLPAEPARLTPAAGSRSLLTFGWGGSDGKGRLSLRGRAYHHGAAPSSVLDCNCSICRRYGTLWAYTGGKQNLSATLISGADALEAYIWGNRWIGFWRCKTCGCLTHHTALGEPANIRGVNARMFVNFDPTSVTIQRTDEAHTGWFWTRPDAPIREGRQPPTDPPGADDWR